MAWTYVLEMIFSKFTMLIKKHIARESWEWRTGCSIYTSIFIPVLLVIICQVFMVIFNSQGENSTWSYRVSPTYAVFTTANPITVDFGLCTRKWGIFALVLLTWSLRNTVFYKSQNPRKAGTLCICFYGRKCFYRRETRKLKYLGNGNAAVCGYNSFRLLPLRSAWRICRDLRPNNMCARQYINVSKYSFTPYQ